ncbi:hypothetical protein [Halomonas sp. BM-2019]
MMVFLLMSWFVTSSDSGTLVLTTILSLGDNEPPAASGSSGAW